MAERHPQPQLVVPPCHAGGDMDGHRDQGTSRASPHPPQCLCLDREEGKAGKAVAGTAPAGTRTGRKKHSGQRNTLVTSDLSWEILAA